MKKMIVFTMLALLMLASFSLLNAEKLKLDLNGVPMQFARTTTAVRDSIPLQAPAVYDSLAVPANAIEVTVIFTNQAGMLYTAPPKTMTATSTDWIFIPKETPITLPVMDAITHIKYKSYTGANAINVIWRRM